MGCRRPACASCFSYPFYLFCLALDGNCGAYFYGDWIYVRVSYSSYPSYPSYFLQGGDGECGDGEGGGLGLGFSLVTAGMNVADDGDRAPEEIDQLLQEFLAKASD